MRTHACPLLPTMMAPRTRTLVNRWRLEYSATGMTDASGCRSATQSGLNHRTQVDGHYVTKSVPHRRHVLLNRTQSRR